MEDRKKTPDCPTESSKSGEFCKSAPIEGYDVCTSEVVVCSKCEGTSILTSTGRAEMACVKVVEGGPDTDGPETSDLEIHLETDVTAVRTAESCKGKTIVDDRCVNSCKGNHPGMTSAKTGHVDVSSGGVIHLMVDIACLVSQSAKMKFGVYSALLRPTSACGEEKSVTGDRVTNTLHEDLADKDGNAMALVVDKSVEAVAEAVNRVKSPGTDLCAVTSSPLIKGSGKGGMAVSLQKVIEKVKKSVFDSVTDGETQPDVVALLAAGQSKPFGLKAVGYVNIPTPLRTEVGNTGHKTVQCSGGHEVHGLTSSGSNVLTNDPSCGRNVDEAHYTVTTIVVQKRPPWFASALELPP